MRDWFVYNLIARPWIFNRFSLEAGERVSTYDCRRVMIDCRDVALPDQPLYAHARKTYGHLTAKFRNIHALNALKYLLYQLAFALLSCITGNICEIWNSKRNNPNNTRYYKLYYIFLSLRELNVNNFWRVMIKCANCCNQQKMHFDILLSLVTLCEFIFFIM